MSRKQTRSESRPTRDGDDPARDPEGRRPYESPAWEVEETFEKAALVCAKANPSDCGAGPIQS